MTSDSFGLTCRWTCAILVWEVCKMETRVRVQLTLAPNVRDKLDELCREKGMMRPALVSLAIDKLWKEEHPDKQ